VCSFFPIPKLKVLFLWRLGKVLLRINQNRNFNEVLYDMKKILLSVIILIFIILYDCSLLFSSENRLEGTREFKIDNAVIGRTYSFKKI